MGRFLHAILKLFSNLDRSYSSRSPDFFITLIGLTTNRKVARQNILTWGTFMDVVDEISSSSEMVDRACKIAKVRKILKHGDKIIITAGVPFGKVGTTNTLRIAKIISESKLT